MSWKVLWPDILDEQNNVMIKIFKFIKTYSFLFSLMCMYYVIGLQQIWLLLLKLRISVLDISMTECPFRV